MYYLATDKNGDYSYIVEGEILRHKHDIGKDSLVGKILWYGIPEWYEQETPNKSIFTEDLFTFVRLSNQPQENPLPSGFYIF